MPISRETKAEVREEIDVRELLIEYRYKYFGTKDYWNGRCISPDHKDSKPSLLIYRDGVYCTACGFRASAWKLLEQFDFADEIKQNAVDNKPRERKEFVARRLDQDLAWFRNRDLFKDEEALEIVRGFGFTDETIKNFFLGIAEVSVCVDYEQKVYETQKRIAVPVYKDGELVQFIYRKLYDNQGGEKITSEAGCGSWLFNGDCLNEEPEEVLILEGWGDVLLAWQNGYQAVTSTIGAGHWNDRWNEALGFVKRIFVVGDRDFAGQKFSQKVKKKLLWAKEVKLPYAYGSKKDVRDFLNEFGKDAFDQLISKTQKQALFGGKSQVENQIDILKREFPDAKITQDVKEHFQLVSYEVRLLEKLIFDQVSGFELKKDCYTDVKFLDSVIQSLVDKHLIQTVDDEIKLFPFIDKLVAFRKPSLPEKTEEELFPKPVKRQTFKDILYAEIANHNTPAAKIQAAYFLIYGRNYDNFGLFGKLANVCGSIGNTLEFLLSHLLDEFEGEPIVDLLPLAIAKFGPKQPVIDTTAAREIEEGQARRQDPDWLKLLEKRFPKPLKPTAPWLLPGEKEFV